MPLRRAHPVRPVRPVLTAAVIFSALLLPVAAARAQTTVPTPAATPAPPVIDKAAFALLKKVGTTMYGLKTYRAECQTTLAYPPKIEGGAPQLRYEWATLTAAKPNLMRYDGWDSTGPTAEGKWQKPAKAPTYIFVCDGKTNWKQFGPSYRTDTRVDAKYQSTILEPWNGFYDAENSPYESITYAEKNGEVLEVRADGSETINGTPCRKVFSHIKVKYGGDWQEYQTTWFIGGDGLLRRKKENVKIGDSASYTRDATLANIVVNVPVTNRAALFAYTPPPGVKSQAQVERDRPALLANGTTAPDFSALDKNGSVVKLSDFKGKVVVLDFWASWCPPCVASMPHNQAVAKKLQTEGLPVVVLAMDNSEERDAFSGWIAKHTELDALTFAHTPRKTANVAGTLYHVSGIPTQYIIDPNGVIRASSVGFEGETNTMEKSIRAAATVTIAPKP